MIDGTVVYHDGVQVDVTSPGAKENLPAVFALWQNYPNPCNPGTTIRYGLPRASHVTLTVYNTLGEQVAVLIDAELEAGYHEARFDGTNLASGVYFYRIKAGNFTQTKKLLLVG